MPNRKPIKQCAVLAYRQRKQGLQVVLVTSLEMHRWVLPKGNIEAGLSARDSASLEAYEEAGVQGAVASRSIGSYEYKKTEIKGGGLCQVTVFPMAVSRVRRDWPEKSMRRRKWMAVEDAKSAVDEKKLKKLITQFAKKYERQQAARD